LQLFLLALSVSLFANGAAAQSSGLVYLPGGPHFSGYLQASDKIEVQARYVFASVGPGVFLGSGQRTNLQGAGMLLRQRFQLHPFAAIVPQYGLIALVGEAEDASGGRRRHTSMSLPLGLYYSVRLLWDSTEEGSSTTLSGFIGSNMPFVFDFTADGWQTTGGLGVQGGFIYSKPVGAVIVDASISLAKYLFGYFYINDLGRDDLEIADGRPFDLGGGLEVFYPKLNAGLRGEYHWTSGLADVQGDTIYFISTALVFKL
jgi:hypothetical protein